MSKSFEEVIGRKKPSTNELQARLKRQQIDHEKKMIHYFTASNAQSRHHMQKNTMEQKKVHGMTGIKQIAEKESQSFEEQTKGKWVKSAIKKLSYVGEKLNAI